jgi:hypothetical protein
VSIAAAATLMGRSHAEALMTATGTISRGNGIFTTNPTTLVETEGTTTVYTGRCRLRIVRSVVSGDASIPGAVAVKDELVLSIPVEATGSGNVRPNDVWTCVTNPLDTSVVGKRLRIAGVHHGTHMTARRFPVEEIS